MRFHRGIYLTARRRRRFRLSALAALFFFALSIQLNALTAAAATLPAPPDAVVEEPVVDTNPDPKYTTPLPWENGGKEGVAQDLEAKKKEEERKKRAAGWIDPASSAGAAAGAKAATGVTLGTVGKWAAIGAGVILVIALAAGGGGGGGGGGGTTPPPAH